MSSVESTNNTTYNAVVADPGEMFELDLTDRNSLENKFIWLSPEKRSAVYLRALSGNNREQKRAALRLIKRERRLDSRVKEKILSITVNILRPFSKDASLTSPLLEIIAAHRVKEAGPIIIAAMKEELNYNHVNHRYVDVLGELGDPAAAEFLWGLYASRPSARIMESLMKLGGNAAYESQITGDVKVLGENDVVRLGIKRWAPNFGAGYSSGKQDEGITGNSVNITLGILFGAMKYVPVPSYAALEKPAAAERLSDLLDTFVRAKDIKGVFLVFYLAENKIALAQNPFPRPRLEAALSEIFFPDNPRLFLALLEKVTNPQCLSLAINVLIKQIDGGGFEKSPLLLETIQAIRRAFPNLDRGSQDEVYVALLRRGINISHHSVDLTQSHENQLIAAYARALEGSRDGIEIIFRELYEEFDLNLDGTPRTKYNPYTDALLITNHPRNEIIPFKDIFTALLEIIQPSDLFRILPVLKSPEPAVARAGLQLLIKIMEEDRAGALLQNNSMKSIINETGYSREAKTVAAHYFALNGVREGADLLFDELMKYEFPPDAPWNPVPFIPPFVELEPLVNGVAQVIRPEDRARIRYLPATGNPNAELIWLALMSSVAKTEDVPTILPLLKSKNWQIRLHALEVLARIPEGADPKILKTEVKFWEQTLRWASEQVNNGERQTNLKISPEQLEDINYMAITISQVLPQIKTVLGLT